MINWDSLIWGWGDGVGVGSGVGGGVGWGGGVLARLVCWFSKPQFNPGNSRHVSWLKRALESDWPRCFSQETWCHPGLD